jgi:hypothetical protein
MRTRVATLLLAAADAATLFGLRPDPSLAGRLAAPHAWLRTAGTDGAAAELAGAALWCVAAWLAIGLLGAAAGPLPGATGRAADALARVLLPRVLYRLVAGATGVGIVLTPVVAGAATPPPGPSRTAPAWPVDNALPAPTWPSTAPRTVPPESQADSHPVVTDHRMRPAAVLVHPGDTLWGIAAGQAGAAQSSARLARTWPRWYAANRAVIGADPDHIVPGQVLHAPTEDRPGGTP